MRPAILAVAVVLAAATAPPLAAAAQPAAPGSPEGVSDPFEKLNRVGFEVEGVLDRWIIGPLSHLYRFLTPGPIGKGIHNLVSNLTEPMATVNGILQVRPKRAARSGARFALNSTIGLAGLIDVAAKAGIAHRSNSFGDTLGRFGMGPGPYIFYPLGGPSSVRDTIGEIVDILADPVHLVNYAYRTEVSVSAGVARGLDQRVRTEDDFKALLSDAADPYATLRSTYLQSRQAEIEPEAGVAPLLPDLDRPMLVPHPTGGPKAAPSVQPPAAAPAPSAPGAQDQTPSLQPLPHQ